ncbi:MAG: RadC family protein [Candidatus Woesearchaeota archaeon]
MIIKEQLKENRPRERMLLQGQEALSNQELLAIILQKGTNQKNVVELSNELLKDGLLKLETKTLSELQKIKGVGFAKACQIKAIYELSKRIKIKNNKNKQIKCAKDVYNLVKENMQNLEVEYFKILLLNTKNKPIKLSTITKGTLNFTVLHPREIFKEAIKENTASIILLHNHPSGDSSPSNEDIDVTNKLIEASKIISIEILDHIIIGKNNYFSFKESGLM